MGVLISIFYNKKLLRLIFFRKSIQNKFLDTIVFDDLLNDINRVF